MTHRSRPFAALLLATLATVVVASGCATLQPPRVQVQRLGRPQVGLTGATLEVTFSVRNPNPDPITIERVHYDLTTGSLARHTTPSLITSLVRVVIVAHLGEPGVLGVMTVAPQYRNPSSRNRTRAH